MTTAVSTLIEEDALEQIDDLGAHPTPNSHDNQEWKIHIVAGIHRSGSPWGQAFAVTSSNRQLIEFPPFLSLLYPSTHAMATTSEANALGYNLDVDYVVRYSFGNVGECSERPASVGRVLKLPCRSVAID